jgi:type VI secretion system secreted protein Hcp
MRAIANLLVAGLLVVGAFSGTAYGQAKPFLKLDGIEGEATDDRHKGEIAIEGLSFAVDQTGIRVAGGRGAPGRSRFSVISLTKRVDKSSPQLFLRCALGSPIPTAVITLQKAGKDPQEFLTITLRNVVVSSFFTSSTQDAVENVGLSYSIIEYSYRPQNPDGSLGEPIRVTFDVNRNKIPAE